MPPVRSAAELLGPHGPFAASLGAYEHRSGQLAMAEAVERTLRDERILFCEAGTGTGKTLAYLVPVLLSRKKRVVVSTATKALQEQIAYKDLPLIARTLDLKPRVAVMKGLSNYVCRRRLREFASTEDGFAIAEMDLKRRGAGSLDSGMGSGTAIRQSGFGQLRFADVLEDAELIRQLGEKADAHLAREERRE